MSTVFDAQVMDSGIGNAIRRVDDVLEQMREFWSRDYRFGASSMIGMMHVQEIRTHLDGLWYSADLFKWDDVASISERATLSSSWMQDALPKRSRTEGTDTTLTSLRC